MKAIDLFCGLGGFSTGAAAAGVEVVFTANHWRLACDYHQVDHPGARHACQDLRQIDWGILPFHDIGLASPSCQGHARARGKERPQHDAMRATMWAVVDCAEYHRQKVWVVENVPEAMTDWVLWPSWKDAMERLGYSVSPHLIDAADHGVPQERLRLYVVCARTRNPLRLKLPRRPHVPVDKVIDWNHPKWSPVEGHVPATMARIAAGRRSFGDRFLAPYYGSGSGLTGRSIHRPCGTLTTRDRWAVIDGDRMRMLQKHEARAIMGFPTSTVLPRTHKESIHMLGNAVCPPVPTDTLLEIQAHA